MKILVLREIRQSWRSFRFPSLFLIILMLAIMDPLTARYMNEIVARYSQGITVVLPPPSPAEGVAQFLGDVVQIGFITIIAITMGSVAGEKASGVTSFIITRPVSRKTYVLSKLIVLLGAVAISIAGGTLVAALYSSTLIGPVDWVKVLTAAVSVFLFSILVLSATFAASMALTSSLAAGGVGLAVLILISVAGALLNKSSIGPYLPSVLSSNINVFLSADQTVDVAGRLVRPGVTTLVLSSILLLLGYRAFRRQALP